MGLDTTHDCWHGAYSAFMRWRKKLAEVAGLPPLELMEGFYYFDGNGTLQAVRCALKTWTMKPMDWLAESIEVLEQSLPIKWDCFKPDVLYELLSHSDCDGELAPELCGPLADRLEELLPLLPDEENWGHIGNWKEKTQAFIDGLRTAAAANESVGFH